MMWSDNKSTHSCTQLHLLCCSALSTHVPTLFKIPQQNEEEKVHLRACGEERKSALTGKSSEPGLEGFKKHKTRAIKGDF